MTGDDKKERSTPDRLADLFVEDILAASDSEILAEFAERHGDIAKNAADGRALFEKSLLAANKAKLHAAQAAVAAKRFAGNVTVFDIGEAREKLRRALAACPPEMKLTLAARKENELSDADVIGMLEDFEELGVLPPRDGK